MQRTKASRSRRSQNSQTQLSVESTDADELSQIVCSKICNADFLKLIDDIFQQFSDSDASQLKRRKLVESILKALGSAKVTTRTADEIINRVTLDFPKYSKQQLVKLVEFSLTSIRNNDDEFSSWKDFLPAILEVLEEEKYVNYMNQEVSGHEYKSLIVQAICNSPWDVEILSPLTKMFGDMSLERSDYDTVIRVLCHKMPSLAPNEIPPFVHQALRLSANHDIRHLLTTLRTYFATQYSLANAGETKESFEAIGVTSLKEIQDIEGTVLYHIYQAAQLNHKSIKDFIRFLKNVYTVPEYILEPFMLSVLLLMSHVYDEQVFDVLKLAIKRIIQDDEKRKQSAWLRGLLDNSQDAVVVVDRIIGNSNKERHFVLKALVELAFVLMSEQKAKSEDNPLWEIGTQILKKLMRKRHDIGGTVLQMLTDKIVAGGLLIQQYTDCLRYMCTKLAIIVLGCQSSVITLLDQLLLIPGGAAEQLLSAILPLARVSSNVRDNLILVLRKALYRIGVEKRQIAVAGFLEMLQNLRTSSLTALVSSQSGNTSTNTTTTGCSSSSSSILTQVTLERDAQGTRSLQIYNKNLCSDILNILRKCFTQEFDVRLRLYEGLYDVTYKNPEISEYVLEMLLAHLGTYYETDESVLPPLRFDLCTDVSGIEAVLQEPIAELIFAIGKIYVNAALQNSETLNRTALILESLSRRMIQTELEHLNVDDRTDLLDNMPKSQQKLQNIKLMIMVYEALIVFKLDSWSKDSTNSAQSIHSLFKGQKRYLDFLKRIAKPKKGDGKTKKDDKNNTTLGKASRMGITKLPSSIMDMDALTKALSLLYSESGSWARRQQQANSIVGSQSFQHYILNACMQLLHQTSTSTGYELQKIIKRNMNSYLKIGELLYKHFASKFKDIHNVDEQTMQLSLDCFKELCTLMCNQRQDRLAQFLSAICERESSDDCNLQLLEIISTLRSFLKSTFKDSTMEEDYLNKIQLTLLEIITQLVYKINFQVQKVEKVFEWAEKFTAIEGIDSTLAIAILQLLLRIEERSCEYGETLNEISFELCGKLGTIDKADVTTDEKFKILHEGTIVQAYNVANNSLREKLNHAAWLLARLRGEQALACAPGTDNEEHRETLRGKERSLCKQLSHIIHILCTLTNSAVDPGQSTDVMFKNLHVLYNLLGSLTKYFLSKSSAQNPAFQAVKFIQVVQLAGKPLKSAFYNLVTHTEENQNKKTKAKPDTHAQRNKVLRETRVIPHVVYEIEQFNKEILLLSKKTSIPLETYIKHSITRDFRINNSQLVEGLEKMDVSALSTQNSHDAENDTRDASRVDVDAGTTPSRKRLRRS